MKALARLPELMFGTLLTLQIGALFALLAGGAVMRRAMVPIPAPARRRTGRQ